MRFYDDTVSHNLIGMAAVAPLQKYSLNAQAMQSYFVSLYAPSGSGGYELKMTGYSAAAPTFTATVTPSPTAPPTRTATPTAEQSPAATDTLEPTPTYYVPGIVLIAMYTEAVTVGQNAAIPLMAFPVGGTPPYTYEWEGWWSGYPPSGMSIASDGTLTGVPVTTCSCVFGLCAVDAGSLRGCSPVTVDVVDVQYNVSAQLTGTTPPDVDGYYSSTYTITISGTVYGPYDTWMHVWGDGSSVGMVSDWTVNSTDNSFIQRDLGQVAPGNFTHTMSRTLWGKGNLTAVQSYGVYLYPYTVAGQEINFGTKPVTLTY
jgi:hypothetical protein